MVAVSSVPCMRINTQLTNYQSYEKINDYSM
nr:MAG TPA: hypothetical protein [Caudoviricetes sp.]